MTIYAVRYYAADDDETRVVRCGAHDADTATDQALSLVRRDRDALVSVTVATERPRMLMTVTKGAPDIEKRFAVVSRTGTFRADRSLVCPGHTGRLPARFHDAYRAAHGGEIPPYVVWSYATPIGWTVGAELLVPLVDYSPTTTRHQRVIASTPGARALA